MRPEAGWLDPYLARCNFPEPTIGFDCAVSGGADSLALLTLAAAVSDDVTAWHVDHGLRPDSAADADIVAGAAHQLGVAFRSVSVDVGAGPGLEARARSARFAALPHGVLTGHTADDQAETVLLAMMRGAGLDGLTGMRSAGHPILGLRRTETETICATMGWTPVQDPSNLSAVHRRNRVRHEIVPLLADVAERDVTAVIARQCDLLADDADLLDRLADSVDPTDIRMLTTAPTPLARRAVRRWLTDSHPPDAAAVERVLAVARGEITATEVSGRRILRRRGRLEWCPIRPEGPAKSGR